MMATTISSDGPKLNIEDSPSVRGRIPAFWSRTDPRRRSWPNPIQYIDNLRHQGPQRLDPVGTGANRYDRQVSREFFRVLDSLINGQEDVKCPGCGPQKLTVPDPRPALLTDGADFVAGELSGELPRKAFIEQDAHWLPAPRGQAQVLRWLAHGSPKEKNPRIDPGYRRLRGSRSGSEEERESRRTQACPPGSWDCCGSLESGPYRSS